MGVLSVLVDDDDKVRGDVGVLTVLDDDANGDVGVLSVLVDDYDGDDVGTGNLNIQLIIPS